jgi:hypothetical protein
VDGFERRLRWAVVDHIGRTDSHEVENARRSIVRLK